MHKHALFQPSLKSLFILITILDKSLKSLRFTTKSSVIGEHVDLGHQRLTIVPYDNINNLQSQKFVSDGKIIQCVPGLRHQWKVKGSEIDRWQLVCNLMDLFHSNNVILKISVWF